MREYFDHAFEGLCNTVAPMVEIAKITLVYVTIPLWIVPYAIYRKIEERKQNKWQQSKQAKI